VHLPPELTAALPRTKLIPLRRSGTNALLESLQFPTRKRSVTSDGLGSMAVGLPFRKFNS
jgi:hypothetical protein